MNLNVSDALQLESLEGATIVAGTAGLENIIRSVGVMEVPDILPWVSAGDLLLTTLFPIRQDFEAQNHLIDDLKGKGLSALAIKPGRYIRSIPKAMIERAEALDFPLLVLPPEASFNQIIVAILSQILEHRAQALERSRTIQREFTRIVLQGGELPEMAKALSQLCESPVSIYDHLCRLLASYPPSDMNPTDDDTIEIPKPIRTLTYQSPTSSPPDRPQVIQPIVIQDQPLGYITVWCNPTDVLPDDHPTILAHAATMVGLLMMKRAAVREVERGYQKEFVEDLLDSPPPRDVLLERGQVFGWDLKRAHAPLLVAPKQPEYSVENNIASRWWDRPAWLHDHILKIVKRNHPKAVVVERAHNILILIPTPNEHGPRCLIKDLKSLGNQMVSGLTHQGAPDLCMGLASPIDIQYLSQAFHKAKQALAVAQSTPSQPRVLHFDELGIDRLLAEFDDPSKLRAFCTHILRPIMAYDFDNGSNWLQTLASFIATGGNIRETAEILYVHYNTVRYRISRIETLLNRSLEDPEDLLAIHFALKIHFLLQI